MWFHLELKGRGYSAARYGIAVSDNPAGPFAFVRSSRVNAGLYPIGFSKPDTTDLKHQLLFEEMKEWWTPEWRRQIERGMFFQRDVRSGQMSRDMTVFRRRRRQGIPYIFVRRQPYHSDCTTHRRLHAP